MSSKIEWTEETWNPITGCTKISPGCKNCYAETMANRLKAMGTKGYENGFGLTLCPERLEQPLKRKKPTTYFVNSMSDLFHEDVPFEFIQKVFDMMDASPHRFQVLTKRAERMERFLELHYKRTNNPWSLSNVWFGISVEDRKYGLPRIEHLRSNVYPMYPSVRFLSIEPLLEDLGPINLRGISWVIVGGESGAKARPMKKEWVENIQLQCRQSGVKFFFKQWGTWGEDGKRRSKKINGSLLNGKVFKGMPV
jgi:protein gp37